MILDRPNIVLQLLLHKNIEFLHVSSKTVFTHVDDDLMLVLQRNLNLSLSFRIALEDLR